MIYILLCRWTRSNFERSSKKLYTFTPSAFSPKRKSSTALYPTHKKGMRARRSQRRVEGA